MKIYTTSELTRAVVGADVGVKVGVALGDCVVVGSWLCT